MNANEREFLTGRFVPEILRQKNPRDENEIVPKCASCDKVLGNGWAGAEIVPHARAGTVAKVQRIRTTKYAGRRTRNQKGGQLSSLEEEEEKEDEDENLRRPRKTFMDTLDPIKLPK